MITKRTIIRLVMAGLTLSSLAIGGCADNNAASTTTSKSDAAAQSVARQHIACTADSASVPNIFADCISADESNVLKANVSSYEDDMNGRLADDEAGKLPILDSILQVPARVEATITRPYIVANKEGQDGKDSIVFDCDTKGVHLQGGTRYTLTFEDIDHCGLSCLDFHPTVHIVSESDYSVDNLNNGLELELIAPDPENRYVSLSFVAPEDGIYCVVVSDTVSNPGDTPVAEDFCYTIYPDNEKIGSNLVITDENNGKEIAYTNEDVQDMRCALRPYVAEWKDGFPSKMSSATINGKTWQEALDETTASIKLERSAKEDVAASQSEVDASSDASVQAEGDEPTTGATTVLDPIVDKQAWDPATMGLGQGFQAVSGLPAPKVSAIQAFELPKERGAFSSDTYMRLIENSTQQERAMGASLSGTFSGGSATVSSSVSTRDVYKYSSTSTTLQIFYENCDTEPAKLDNSSYKLTKEAKALLRKDPAEFRKTYGDYFVAGTYSGAKYVGNIAIRTSSTEQLNEVKQKLSAVIAGQKIDEEFSNSLKDALQNCDISLSVHTEGGSDVDTSNSAPVAAQDNQASAANTDNAVPAANANSVASTDNAVSAADANSAASATDANSATSAANAGNSDSTAYYNAVDGTWSNDGPTFTTCSGENALSIDALIKGYQNFKKSVEVNPEPKLTHVYAYLLEFSQIPDCASLDNQIPVDPEIFISMRRICRDYLHLTSATNEYVGLPISDFFDGRNHLDSVRTECDDLGSRFKSALRTSSNNPAEFIANWSTEMQNAKQKINDRLDRYYFIRRLTEANNSIGVEDLQPNRNVLFGYSQYLYSKTCNDDFVDVTATSMHEEWCVGRHHWHPRMTCTTCPAGIAAGIEWTNSSNCDTCRFSYMPPLCRSEVGVDCEGGYDRDANWDLKAYWINSDNYKELILPTQRQ